MIVRRSGYHKYSVVAVTHLNVGPSLLFLCKQDNPVSLYSVIFQTERISGSHSSCLLLEFI